MFQIRLTSELAVMDAWDIYGKLLNHCFTSLSCMSSLKCQKTMIAFVRYMAAIHPWDSHQGSLVPEDAQAVHPRSPSCSLLKYSSRECIFTMISIGISRSKMMPLCSKYTLLRLDAGRLPFETGSLAAIHAGKIFFAFYSILEDMTTTRYVCLFRTSRESSCQRQIASSDLLV